jgi:hypothetical protein
LKGTDARIVSLEFTAESIVVSGTMAACWAVALCPPDSV